MKNKLKYLKTFEEFQEFIQYEYLLEEQSNNINYVDKYNIFRYLLYPVNERNYFNILNSIMGEDLLMFKEKSLEIVSDYIKFFFNGNISADVKINNNSLNVTINSFNGLIDNSQKTINTKIEFVVKIDSFLKGVKSILDIPVRDIKVDSKLLKVNNKTTLKHCLLIPYLDGNNKIIIDKYVSYESLLTNMISNDLKIDVKSVVNKFKHNKELAESFNKSYESQEESINESFDKISDENTLKTIISFKSPELQKNINKKINIYINELFRDIDDEGQEILLSKRKNRKKRDRNAPRLPDTFPWEFDKKYDVAEED